MEPGVVIHYPARHTFQWLFRILHISVSIIRIKLSLLCSKLVAATQELARLTQYPL